MRRLSELAMNNKAVVLFFTLLVLVAGPLSFSTHPSREDPKISIRTAVVSARYQGMSPERMENLITKKIEERIREIPEVEHIESTVQNGSTIIRANVYDRYSDMDPIWIQLRNRMDDVKADLPDGTEGPFVNDDYGDVAMASIALTAEGFSISEMREAARRVRDQLYSLGGVRKITLYGVEPERIFVEIDNIRLSQFGISGTDIINAISKQNIILPGGTINTEGQSIFIEPSGNFEDLKDITDLQIQIPGQTGQVAYLKDIAKISRGYADPPKAPVFYNGKPAIVLGVSMIDQYDSFKFADDLKRRVRLIEQSLPIGYKFDYITFQPNEISIAINGVMNNLYQTIVIVLIVVMVFLGWRTGLLVGAMVPLVMLLSILVMRVVGIELERMSLATLIIALGLLVDNGIVVSEEIGRRLTLGEERFSAVINAGRDMSVPLLTSSLTTVFAFMPLMLAESAAGEYTRSISLVIAITLIGSWLVAMVVMPVFSFWFFKPGPTVDEETLYNRPLFKRYRSVLDFILKRRALFLASICALLVSSIFLFSYVPKVFFPASERTQLQVLIDAPVGSNSYKTLASIKPLSAWLMDKNQNPEVKDHVAYIADGGPRFYLGLNPIDADPFRAYLIVNVNTAEDVRRLLEKVRIFAARNMPEVRVTPKPMSMGPAEAGLVEYRFSGPSDKELKRLSLELQAAMRAIPATRNIKDNWENPTIKVLVQIDQTRARRVGITSEQIAQALNANFAGTSVTVYREGDQTIPVILREAGTARTNIDRLRTINVARVDGRAIPLLQVATFEGITQYAYLQRRDLERVIKISGVNPGLSAQALDKALGPDLERIQKQLKPGYRFERGGELEDSSKAQGSLFANFPLAFALILLVLIAQFDSFKKPLMILLTVPLIITGVALALFIMPGANFGFMAILGLLALFGIFLNNAIVLIDKIDMERTAGLGLHDAIIKASINRMKPILITTATTVLGLVPIILSRDVLFYDLALVISGGMIVGTLFTLGVVPVLYSLFFREEAS